MYEPHKDVPFYLNISNTPQGRHHSRGPELRIPIRARSPKLPHSTVVIVLLTQFRPDREHRHNTRFPDHRLETTPVRQDKRSTSFERLLPKSPSSLLAIDPLAPAVLAPLPPSSARTLHSSLPSQSTPRIWCWSDCYNLHSFTSSVSTEILNLIDCGDEV